jgi:hypothetical protein
VVYRALSVDALAKALHGTISVSGMILFIILGATHSRRPELSGETDSTVSAIFGQRLPPFAILAGRSFSACSSTR